MNIPKHYRLIKDNKDHFLIHDKRDNKQFPIAKKDLHPASQIKVMQLQKFDDGGEAESDSGFDRMSDNRSGGEGNDALNFFGFNEQSPDQALAKEQRAEKEKEIFGLSPSEPQISPGIQETIQPQQPISQAQPAALPQSQAPRDPAAAQAPSSSVIDQAFNQQAKGIQGMAGASTEMNNSIAAAEQAHQEAMKDFNMKSQQEAWNQKVELDNLQEKMMNQKIDPNRFWANKSTGSKISAAIGVLLSGIGAGLQGTTKNMAMEVIDKQINNDIEAQKAEIGKTQTLYGFNLRRYNDDRLADQATRLQMNENLQSQIKIAAAKSGTLQAQAQANMMLGQLNLQKAQVLQKFGETSAMNKVLGGGTGKGGLPISQIPPQLLQDPKFQEKLVVINGNAYQGTDKESAAKVRDIETLAGPIADHVAKLKTLGPEALVPGTEEYNLAKGIMGDLAVKLPLLSGATIGAKRVNSEEIAHQVERIKDPTKWSQIMSGAKEDYLLESLEKDVDTVREKHLINYKGMGNLGFKSSGKLPLNGQR